MLYFHAESIMMLLTHYLLPPSIEKFSDKCLQCHYQYSVFTHEYFCYIHDDDTKQKVNHEKKVFKFFYN